MRLHTPLSRVLGLGAAGEGTGHFVAQRISSVALLLLGVWLLYGLFSLESFAFLEVQRFVGDPMNAVLLMLLTVTMAHHSSLGIQVVIEDYVHEPLVKILSLIASRFVHTFVAVAALYAIVTIGLNRL